MTNKQPSERVNSLKRYGVDREGYIYEHEDEGDVVYFNQAKAVIEELEKDNEHYRNLLKKGLEIDQKLLPMLLKENEELKERFAHFAKNPKTATEVRMAEEIGKLTSIASQMEGALEIALNGCVYDNCIPPIKEALKAWNEFKKEKK